MEQSTRAHRGLVLWSLGQWEPVRNDVIVISQATLFILFYLNASTENFYNSTGQHDFITTLESMARRVQPVKETDIYLRSARQFSYSVLNKNSLF